jgi:cell division protein FtsZ
MPITFNLSSSFNSIIKVMGVGGGGGNAVNNMFKRGIRGVDFVICNTDVQVLDKSPIPNKVRLGAEMTQGLGAGANPEVGRKAAMESMEDIRGLLRENTKMLFITAGMGGGTGTGAAPVIARMAREMGILTVGIVTTPFTFEGDKRMKVAMEGVKQMEECVDTLLVISNANLMQICPKNIKTKEAYLMADNVLTNAAKGIAEIITVDGYVNVDFADVNTIMRNSGTALMGSATFTGENRARHAVEEALNSPLLDHVDIMGASGILYNITASEDTLTLEETNYIGEYIKNAVGPDAQIIFGQVNSDDLGDALSLTVIATGFNKKERVPLTAANPAAKQPAREDKKPATNRPVQSSLPLMTSDAPAEPRPREASVPAEAAPLRAQNTLEDRLAGVSTLDFDLSDPGKVKQLEDIPAYVRRQMRQSALEAMGDNLSGPAVPRQSLSRTSVDADANGRFTLRENNSFLYDNPD